MIVFQWVLSSFLLCLLLVAWLFKRAGTLDDGDGAELLNNLKLDRMSRMDGDDMLAEKEPERWDDHN